MFNSGLGGFHSDVLSAEPADEEGKSRLIEEIKNRAKGSLSTKNYPEAIQLYTKGIELRPSDAVLYANRSMCHLQMGNGNSALLDAESAIENDATYAKYVAQEFYWHNSVSLYFPFLEDFFVKGVL